DQDRVGDPAFDPFLEASYVGDEDVVTDELYLAPEPVGEQLPSLPIVLGHSVLDADDRVAGDPSLIQVDELERGECHAFTGELVGAVGVELAGGHVDCQRELLTS